MDTTVFSKSDICHSCLHNGEGQKLQKISLKHGPLLALFEESALVLCYICKKKAENFESFFENVSHVQRLLQGIDTIEPSFLDNAKTQVPAKVLTKHILEPIDIGLELVQSSSLEEGNYAAYTGIPTVQDINVKLEVKQEGPSNYLNDGFLDEDELALPYHSMLPQYTALQDVKQENGVNELLVGTSKARKYTKRKTRNIKKEKVTKVKKEKKISRDRKRKYLPDIGKKKISRDRKRKYLPDIDYYEMITISREECLRERELMAQSDKYLKLPHKCPDCVKGYQYKATYITHMEKHNKTTGEFVCDICKQRRDSYEKLKQHSQYHRVRYRCRACGVTRMVLRSIYEHYMAAHSPPEQSFACPVCAKNFKRPFSLRKHMSYVHGTPRVECDHCQKTYANKEVLRKHIIEIHLQEDLPLKSHACTQCNKCFKAPSLLKKHMIKHTERRDFYCVECDKSFKSDTILKHHLKTATPHANYTDLHHPCLLCDKRYSSRRGLENHVNSIHLKVKPFQCDQCDRSYVNKWSLKDHKRLVHDGYKRPLVFPCPMCDKVFDRNQIRKSHILTHTGERPFACALCPASFAQRSVLRTHVKLVHLQLTRDGRAKHRHRLD